MNTDLSLPLSRALAEAREQGETFRSAGEFKRAAAHFKQAARLARRQALESVDETRLRRLSDAAQLDRLAVEVEQRENAPIAWATENASESDREESRRIASLRTTTQTRWDDIIGLAEVKDRLRLFIRLSTGAPAQLQISKNRAVLLYGPPGTGKSMLGAALASDVNGAFYQVNAADLLSKWFGESARLAAELYRQARAHPASVIFIDEVDALCPTRDADMSGAERRLLAALLCEMSGVSSTGGAVVTVAATNVPWDLDRAALSRFGTQLYVSLPDSQDRALLMNSFLRKRGLTTGGPLENIAARADGLSSRQIVTAMEDGITRMLVRSNPGLLDRGNSASTALKVTPLEESELMKAFSSLHSDASAEIAERYIDFGGRNR